MVQDIDVLIAERDLETACRSLATLRFRPVTDELESYLSYLDRRPHEGASSGNHFLVLRDDDQNEIDLHWRLGVAPPPALASDTILARAQAARLYRRDILVPAPMDAMMLTVHHVVRGHFAPETTVKDLVDLRTWWMAEPRQWGAAAMLAHAATCGLGAPLQALWRILAAQQPESPIAGAVVDADHSLPPAERRRAAHLAGAFAMQLESGGVNGDLLRLLSPTTIGRFLARRVYDRAATERFTRQFEAEFDLPQRRSDGERLLRLLRDLLRLTPRKLAAYRALRHAHQGLARKG
jgi:hypothetical protein